MTSFESNQPGPDLARLNALAEQQSHELAVGGRLAALLLIHETIGVLMKADLETQQTLEEIGYPDGAEVRLFLLTDYLAAPEHPHGPLNTLSYRLVRTKERQPGDLSGADEIGIYIPVASDFSLGNNASELPAVEDIDGFFVEFVREDIGTVRRRRYAVTRTDVYEYVGMADEDQDVAQDELFQRGMWALLSENFSASNPMVQRLIEDHRNFTLIPQRCYTIGQPGVTDI